MKYSQYAIVAIATILTIGCNKQKAAIDDTEKAAKEAKAKKPARAERRDRPKGRNT